MGITNYIRMFLGLIIMAGGVYGHLLEKFDLTTMLIIITCGIVFSETASIQIKLREIELKNTR